MRQIASLNIRVALCAALAAWVCTACSDDDPSSNLAPMFPQADGGGLTTLDASPVLGADTGVVQPQTDGGVLPIPGLDSGPGPVVGGDGGPVLAGDSGPVIGGDGGPVVGGDGGPAPDGGTQRPDLGEGDGNDVITIGDSWMSLGGGTGIQESLEKISKRNYRLLGVPGTKLLDEVIPNQYKSAKTQDPDIKTVIMTGGGNDVLQDPLLLFGACADENFDSDPACKARIDEVANRLVALWAEMARDGVQDVVVIGYSVKVMPLGLVATSKSVRYSDSKITPLCGMVPAPLRCHSMNTDMAVPDLTLSGDGIHPDAATYDKIGAAVWELMKAKGMRR
jgi:hypothetical protein